MSEWIPNKYYLLSETNRECIKIVTSLLRAYTLTRGCLDTLGEQLVSKLEFVFFSGGEEFITQGESGRDIFMLCTGMMDVLVNNQVVVQMNSPTLVGEKSIISPDSKRAATIRVAEGVNALAIKVPMGEFIRDFKDLKLEDKSFSQEVSIFQNVFQGIQGRLFEYMHMQKKLSEETNTSLALINQQIIAKMLDNQKDPGWQPETWDIAKNFLKIKLNLSWPPNVPINVQTLRALLQKYLLQKYSKQNVDPGKRGQDWRDLLIQTCSFVLKNIPDSAKPVKLPDLKLFNPNIYRMRISTLVGQVGKKFEKNLRKPEAKDDEKLNFFGKGDKANEFDMPMYLDSFDKRYSIKNQRRLQAQITQKYALIAAEIENSFNVSVVQMQKFLGEVKSKNIQQGEVNKAQKIDYAKLKSWTDRIFRGIENFRDSSQIVFATRLGKVTFNPKSYPRFPEFLRAYRVQFTKDQMTQSFNGIINSIQFKGEYLSTAVLHKSFHICDVSGGDEIVHRELLNGYWFSLSSKIILNVADEKIIEFKEGMLIGCEWWNEGVIKNEIEDQLNVKVVDTSLALVLPSKYLPWTSNPEPQTNAFIEHYLPMMQWLLNKQIGTLQALQEARDQIVDQWREIQNAIIMSKKIEAFEQKPYKLPKNEQKDLINWLNGNLGMKLNPAEPIPLNRLSKTIYNFILHQVGKEHPEISIEQRGNQAYTKWRNILLDVVSEIRSLDRVIKIPTGKPPRPVWNILVKQLTPILSPFFKNTWIENNPLTSGEPSLNILSVFHPDKIECVNAIRAYENTMESIGNNIVTLIQEIRSHRSFLAEISQERDSKDMGSTTGSFHEEMINESIQNLTRVLGSLSP